MYQAPFALFRKPAIRALELAKGIGVVKVLGLYRHVFLERIDSSHPNPRRLYSLFARH